MQFENFVTDISSSLPNFTVRVFLLLLILVWILFSILLYKIPTKKINSLKLRYLLTGTFFLLLGLSCHLPYLKLNEFFESYLFFISIPLLTLSLILFTKHILRIFEKRKILKYLLITELLILPLIFFLLLGVSLFTVPRISTNISKEENILTDIESITIYFSSPLKITDFDIHMSPESNVNIQYETYWGIEGLLKSITLIPNESFLPNQRVVIYTTGIQRLFPGGVKHENSQEFFTPKDPDIESVVLGADIQNVSVEQEIILDLDSQDQEFVQWDALFTPEAEYEIKRGLGDSVVIKPLKLKQGTQYELQILKSIIKYNPITLEKISTESEEIIKTVQFRTAPAPGITGFNRSDEEMSTSEPLIIYFESPLRSNSVDGRVSISPEIEGDISFSEDMKQLIFTPKQAFEKNTEYKVTLLKGIENILGGYIEEDTILTFKTLGEVYISYASPRNNSSNISINTASIGITFNQPVDRSTVQERFSVSPNISGTFSWSGNTMIYTFSQSLAYGTKYTFKISPGIKATYGIDSSSTLSSSFTTKHETFTLDVPLFYQSESFTCNLAATRMVLSYKGVSSTENDIRSSIGIGSNPDTNWVEGYGVHWNPISTYISSRGVSNNVKRGWNLNDALQEVKNGNPVLTYMYNGYSSPKGEFLLEGGYSAYKGMHSEVIIGFVGTPQSPVSVITNDPWRGKRTHKVSSFNYLWSYLGNTAIVIY